VAETGEAAVPEVAAAVNQAAADTPPPAAPAVQAAVAEALIPPEPIAPIIVKKIIEEGHAGAHGGAWKIALADMMTAMMAFFLLMWLLGATNSDQRKGISDYFKPSALTKSVISVNQTSGAEGVMGGQSIIDETALPRASAQTGLMQILTPRDATGTKDSEKDKTGDTSEDEKRKISNEVDQANFEKLQKELNERLSQDQDLAKLKDQVNFVREKEGLRVEIIDKADFSMFGMGTTTLSPKSQALIEEIARSIGKMPNKIKVRGHTDSVPYNGPERNNWSLSAQRAEVTRQVIKAKGVDEKRISRIEGVADTEPFNPANGLDPRNRRISITLMYQNQ
jgi:chemotaxis protein MotB